MYVVRIFNKCMWFKYSIVVIDLKTNKKRGFFARKERKFSISINFTYYSYV